MGYDRDDDRYGGSNRWRGRESSGGDRDRNRDYGGRSPDYDRAGSQYARGRDDDDRGFLDRAGDEVRSWFGDDDAERRREADERRWEQERGMSGSRSNRASGGNDEDRNTGTGWGNQRGWDDVRPSGSAGGYGAPSSGGGDRGRQTGGGRYGASGLGGSGARHPGLGGSTGYGGGRSPDHDPHYSQWRERQMSSLDRDYDEYRREHQSKFEEEFGSWRNKRQGQRQSLGKAQEHMEVVGSDGQHVGTVDKIRGDRIILTKNDEAAGGHHHSIPCSWIDKVEDKVIIDKTADQAMKAWRDEEHNRALFEREDSGSDGPHVLDRSFSGTYKDR